MALVECSHRLSLNPLLEGEPNHGHQILTHNIADKPGDHINCAKLGAAPLRYLEGCCPDQIAVEVAASYPVKLVNQRVLLRLAKLVKGHPLTGLLRKLGDACAAVSAGGQL